MREKARAAVPDGANQAREEEITVPAAGFEPATYGLGNRAADAATASGSTTSESAADCLAVLLGALREQEPELASIVEGWPYLSETVKHDLVVLVQQAREKRAPERARFERERC